MSTNITRKPRRMRRESSVQSHKVKWQGAHNRPEQSSRDLNTKNTKNTWQAIQTITGYSTSAGMDSIDSGHEKNSVNVNEAAGPDNITQSPPLNWLATWAPWPEYHTHKQTRPFRLALTPPSLQCSTPEPLRVPFTLYTQTQTWRELWSSQITAHH